MEIVGLIYAEGNPDNIDRSLFSSHASSIDLEQRLPRTRKEELEVPPDMTPFLDKVQAAKSPRILWNHLPMRKLPPDLVKHSKVHVARHWARMHKNKQ